MRNRAAVWSWSSDCRSSVARERAANRTAASTNQVSRLSWLTATGMLACGTSSSATPRRFSASCSRSAACSASCTSTWPSSVARAGTVRCTSRRPMRSSSALTRCETAEGVTDSAAAARSKLPSRTTAASARRLP
ncbi:Uncharacterised protein [Bordetella pertussis]|nr:Uncharacterised protein [Bordetella pertussis]